MYLVNSASGLRIRDSLENFPSATKDVRKTGGERKNEQKIDEVELPCSRISQENVANNNNSSADNQSKPSVHMTCTNKCKLRMRRVDRRRNGQEADNKNNSVDVCINGRTICSISNSSSNLSSKNSTGCNKNKCPMDKPSNNNNNNNTSSRGNYFNQTADNDNIDMIPNSNPNPESSIGDDIRKVPRDSKIADDQNKYSLDVIYNNPNMACFKQNDLRQTSIKTETVAGQNSIDIGNESPSTDSFGEMTHSDQCEDEEGSQATLTDNHKTFSTVSSGESGVRVTSTKCNQVGVSQNECSINVSFNNALTAKKSPDLRLPKRINCWDINPPATSFNSEKPSFHSKVNTSAVGQGYISQASKNTTTNNAHSLQKMPAPNEIKLSVTIDENKFKTQTSTTKSCSWDLLTAQTHTMESKDSTAEHQGNVKQDTENTDKSVTSNSIPPQLSNKYPVIPIRKRKRGVDEDSLLSGSKWNSMLNSTVFHLRLRDDVHLSVPDEPSQTKQRYLNLGQVEGYTEMSREPTSRQYKHIENGEKDINRQEEKTINLETNYNYSNEKEKCAQFNLESTANSAGTQKLRNPETKLVSKSAPYQKILLTFGAQASLDKDYTTTPLVVKHCNECAPNSINSTRRERQVNCPPVQEQIPGGISGTRRERQVNCPAVQEKIPSGISGTRRERQVNCPAVQEKIPSGISGTHRERQVNCPAVQEKIPSGISGTRRKRQVNCPAVQEKIPSGISGTHRERQVNCPAVQEKIPSGISGTHRERQVNCPAAQEQIPSGISGTCRERQVNCPAVQEKIPNGISGTRRERQVNCPAVQEQIPNGISGTHRERQVNCPAVQEHKPHLHNCIHRGIQVGYCLIGEPIPSNQRSTHRERSVNCPPVQEQIPNFIHSINRGIQVGLPAIGEQIPSCISSTHRERQANNCTGIKAKENSNNYQGEMQGNDTVPRWTTMHDSEKYLNSYNYSDYKEITTPIPTQDSSIRQQCQQCKRIQDEFRRDNLMSYNSVHRVDPKINDKEQSHEVKQGHMEAIRERVQRDDVNTHADKNKDMRQWSTKESRDFQNFSSECLVCTVNYNLIPSKDVQAELQEQPQTGMKTLDELGEQSSKGQNTQHIKSQYTSLKSVAENKLICVEELSQDSLTELYEQLPKTKWKIQKTFRAEGNTGEKYITLKSIGKIDQINEENQNMHVEEKPRRDIRSGVHNRSKMKWGSTGKLSKCAQCGKMDVVYSMPLKSISELNQMHAEEKPSRDIQSEVHDLYEMKWKTTGNLSKCGKTDAEWRTPLKSISDLNQMHVEEKPSRDIIQPEVHDLPKPNQSTKLLSEQVFTDVKHTMLKQKCNINMNSESKMLLLQDKSPTKPTTEYKSTSCINSIIANNELKKLPQVIATPTNTLNTQVETASVPEKCKHKTKSQSGESREPKEKAAVKPVQHYKIKWMTRKENELNEQTKAEKLATANRTVARKERRRQRPTSKKSKAQITQSKCIMDTLLEPNASTKHLQSKASTSESSWYDYNMRLEQNAQGTSSVLFQNHKETHREETDIKKENSFQYKEQSGVKSEGPDYICRPIPTIIAHTDGNPSSGCERVGKLSQKSIKPITKDATTYCNFKRTRKIVQQLKTEYGNFEALADRMKHITHKVLAQVNGNTQTANITDLDKKIKDLYEYCQMRQMSSLKDIEHESVRKNRSKFLTVEHDGLKKCHHKFGETDNVGVLSGDTELEPLLQTGVLGRGCCELPPSLIHMHGIISNFTNDENLQVLRLQYGDTHYMIEDDPPKPETKVEKGESPTDGCAALTVISENLWQKIKDLYDFSEAVHTPTTFASNTSVNPDDAVFMAQSTESTDTSGLQYEGTSEDSLARLKMQCNDISVCNDNILLNCDVIFRKRSDKVVDSTTSENIGPAFNDISGWNENTVAECNSSYVGNGNILLEGDGMSTTRDRMVQECNNKSANSGEIGSECKRISIANRSTLLDSNYILKRSVNLSQECNDFDVGNDNSTLKSDGWARNMNKQLFNYPESESKSTREEQKIIEQSLYENKCFVLDSDKAAHETHNLDGSGRTTNTTDCFYHANETHNLYGSGRTTNTTDCFYHANETHNLYGSGRTTNTTDCFYHANETHNLYGSGRTTNTTDCFYHANETHNLDESGRTTNTTDCFYHQPEQSCSYPRATNSNQLQYKEESSTSCESNSLLVNAELIDNSILNLTLKFPSTDTAIDVNIDGPGELIHSSTERLPISVALEHVDLGQENAPMVTTTIEVTNMPKNQNDESIITLDSESVNIGLAMECTPHSEQDVQQEVVTKHGVSRQFFLLKQGPLTEENSQESCHASGEMLKNAPRTSQGYGPNTQQVTNRKREVVDNNETTGAYTLNIFVIRQPEVELFVKSGSESSLA